jgi:N-acetylglucosamine-6-phosphate deacetylase
MMSLTPARIMEVDHFTGSLTEGKSADVVIFDEGINIKMTMVKGNVIYQAG